MSSTDTEKKTAGDSGVVIAVHHPLISVSGLMNAIPREMVHFDEGGWGQVISLKEARAEIMIFSRKVPRLGTAVTTTHERLNISLSAHTLGTLISPLGKTITGKQENGAPITEMTVDVPPPHLSSRAPIKTTLKTGVLLTDLLLPLGKGQRQLIVGDRKTGKSSFLLQVARCQIEQGSIVVYGSIGKRLSELKQLYTTCQEQHLLEHMVIVGASASDPSSIITMAPFTAMTVAEYFRDLGHDVVVILDDLTTHAKYVREISLLSRMFPGRESYPGDIFYTHARLLERAGNFHVKGKTASITALPVAETNEGELTGFIVSNLISITDGHLLFDSEAFARGLRPAVHTRLSVTRVGKQTQTPLERAVNYSISLFLTQYEKTRSLMQFGAELTDVTQAILARGDAFMALFNQSKGMIYAPAVQLVMAMATYLDWFSGKSLPEIGNARECFASAYAQQPKVSRLTDLIVASPTLEEMKTNLEKNKETILSICRV